jgi:hypothetical protein
VFQVEIEFGLNVALNVGKHRLDVEKIYDEKGGQNPYPPGHRAAKAVAAGLWQFVCRDVVMCHKYS